MTPPPPPDRPPPPPPDRDLSAPARPAALGPLDYRPPPGSPGHPPPPQPTGAVGFSLPAFLLTAFATTVVLILLGGVVPRLEMAFRDFGVKLPAVTQVVLGASRLFTRTPVWLTGPVIVLGMATAVALIPLPRRALRLLISVVLALIVLGFALAVLLPMVQLITTVSGGGGHQ
jgi:type II secretory pathway component PulF